jgi:hypothetical protein
MIFDAAMAGRRCHIAMSKGVDFVQLPRRWSARKREPKHLAGIETQQPTPERAAASILFGDKDEVPSHVAVTESSRNVV